MKKEIRDFGEYIPGAAKDRYRFGDEWSSVSGASEDEMRQLLKKKVLSPFDMKNGEALEMDLLSRYNRLTAYAVKTVVSGLRSEVPKNKMELLTKSGKTFAEEYFTGMQRIFEILLTAADPNDFYDDICVKIIEEGLYNNVLFSKKVIRMNLMGENRLRSGADKELFGMSLEDVTALERKKCMVLPVEDHRQDQNPMHSWEASDLAKSEGKVILYRDDSGTERAAISRGYARAQEILKRSLFKDESAAFAAVHDFQIIEFYGTKAAAEKAVEATARRQAETEFEIKHGKTSRKKGTQPKRFVPDVLNEVVRNGGRQVYRTPSERDFLKGLGMRGVQWGNSTPQKERVEILKRALEAFRDLADALDIEDSSVSGDGVLAIAFGARGHGRALAHYEPGQKVINLTRMKGAGSLAHEWGHFLDNMAYGHFCNGAKNSFMTKEALKPGVCDEFPAYAELVRFLKADTAFRRGSLDFDHIEGRKEPYWASREEMFARAFSCYISDKLSALGIRDDYLVRDYTYEGETSKADPQGDERKQLDRLFDKLIDELKEKGILKQASREEEKIPACAGSNPNPPSFKEGKNGQFRMF